MTRPDCAAVTFDEEVVALGVPEGKPQRPPLVSSSVLAAVKASGTRHIYADTADVAELQRVLASPEGVRAEIDGNTVNQPLVHAVLERMLESSEPAAWARELRDLRPAVDLEELSILLYAVVCGRIGNLVAWEFASGRPWEVSLQLHMGLVGRREKAVAVGRLLRRMVPSAIVKVPFAPHAPDCFLVARDLEREGIPVNFTSTFSARQVLAAALLSGVQRTNVFMGRLNQGLKARHLGEHACLEAQRALREVRRGAGVSTQLIVASIRERDAFLKVAGCDAFTAPCEVLADLVSNEGPEGIRSRLETSYEADLGIDGEVTGALGTKAIARLYRVERELLEFLLELRRGGLADLRGGEELHRRFDDAGFADFFHFPTAREWAEIRRGKTPDLGGELVRRIPIDTLYSLHADADFDRHQAEMDRVIRAHVSAPEPLRPSPPP